MPGKTAFQSLCTYRGKVIAETIPKSLLQLRWETARTLQHLPRTLEKQGGKGPAKVKLTFTVIQELFCEDWNIKDRSLLCICFFLQ